MRQPDAAETLRLLDQAVLKLQARQHPGRPAFYALDRLRSEIERTRGEVAASAR